MHQNLPNEDLVRWWAPIAWALKRLPSVSLGHRDTTGRQRPRAGDERLFGSRDVQHRGNCIGELTGRGVSGRLVRKNGGWLCCKQDAGRSVNW